MADRNLDHLHPDLKPLCQQWLDSCQQNNIAAIITFIWRSIEEQDALYAQGRTAPGKIVTNARGGQSKHNFTIDGKPASKAFDFAIKRTDGSLNWDPDSNEWLTAIAIGRKLGMKWGGDFKSIKDMDHFEIA